MIEKQNLKILYATVFVCGFVVMAFEIIGSRVLAPFFGTSTYVWVSIIGIILLAMSAGYYYGGQQADKSQNHKRLASFVLLAAIFICLMNLGKNQLLMPLSSLGINALFTSSLAAIILFGPTAFLLAAVFPFALRLGLTNIEDSGKAAGRFYAVSTVGSILGTFLSATVLIPTFGTTNILWILASLLLLTGIIIGRQSNKILIGITALLLISNLAFSQLSRPYLDVDSAYNRIWIYDAMAQGREARYLSINGHVNAGMWIDNPVNEQLFPYSEYFNLGEHFNPSFESCLMLGAGGYSYPKLFQEQYPDKQMDVVEIDSELTKLSTEHFHFVPASSTRIFHQDARMYLQGTDKKYDIIINDVFTSPFEVPFHMTTQESYQQIEDRLNPAGVLLANVLGSAEGDHSLFLKSQVKTAMTVFDNVLVFQVDDGQDASIKNNILVAYNRLERQTMTNQKKRIQAMLDQQIQLENLNLATILTDDHAPANWMLRQ
jgi:spermidine synthase